MKTRFIGATKEINDRYMFYGFKNTIYGGIYDKQSNMFILPGTLDFFKEFVLADVEVSVTDLQLRLVTMFEKVIQHPRSKFQEQGFTCSDRDDGLLEISGDEILARMGRLCRLGFSAARRLRKKGGDVGGGPLIQAGVDLSAITDIKKVEADLSKLIPGIQYYESYVPRRLACGLTDIEMLERFYELRYPVLMVGVHGAGKTHAIAAVCAKNKLPMKYLNLNKQTTVEDLVGQWVPGETGGFVWKDGILTIFLKYGGVLVVDEINAADPGMLFPLHSVTDERRSLTITQHLGETIIAHPNFWIAAAANPDYEGTQPMNEALKSRFLGKMLYDYNDRVEAHIIPNERLLDLAKKVRVMHRKGELMSTVSTRDLKAFVAIEASISYAAATENFLAGVSDSERSVFEELFRLHMETPQEVANGDTEQA